MTDLAPMTALGGTLPCADRIGAVTITEIPDLAIASVALRRGGSLPDMPGPGRHANGAIWAGPEQWLLTAPYDVNLAAKVKARLGPAVSVTDQTDAWAAFDVAGPVEPMFERLCSIDIRAMQAGHATRTVIDHLGCFVIREADRIRVLGARSSAAALHHALIAAARAIA